MSDETKTELTITSEHWCHWRDAFDAIGDQQKDAMETINVLESELSAARKAFEDILEYSVHDTSCILARFQAGEPTENGGYRTMYAGKWYQLKPVDETPKCSCGLDEIYSSYDRVKGESK